MLLPKSLLPVAGKKAFFSSFQLLSHRNVILMLRKTRERAFIHQWPVPVVSWSGVTQMLRFAGRKKGGGEE